MKQLLALLGAVVVVGIVSVIVDIEPRESSRDQGIKSLRNSEQQRSDAPNNPDILNPPDSPNNPNTPSQSTSESSSTDSQDDPEFERARHDMPASWNLADGHPFDLVIPYPGRWGNMVVSKREDGSYHVGFDATYYGNGLENEYMDIDAYEYNETDKRYREVCDWENSVDLCDTLKKIDMVVDRATSMQRANMVIAAQPAHMFEYYDAPSGNVTRVFTFYSPRFYYEITAGYFVHDILMTKHPNGDSTTGMFHAEFGEDGSDVVTKFEQRFGEAARPMLDFFAEFDIFIAGLYVDEISHQQ